MGTIQAMDTIDFFDFLTWMSGASLFNSILGKYPPPPPQTRIMNTAMLEVTFVT